MENRGHLYRVSNLVTNFNEIPLNEYPRPQLVRDDYLILNGAWDFFISKEKKIPETFKQKIIVPYAVESLLSGVHQLVEPDEYLIYQKKVKLPKGFKGKTILIHFHGIDQFADIYLNHQLVKSHQGIASFTITTSYQEELIITLIINDQTDLNYLARGKQTLSPGECFYTSSSGIIKTVWLEAVPTHYISDVKFYPDYDKKLVKILVKANTEEKVEVTLENKKHLIKPNELTSILLHDFKPWSPEHPYLYPVKLKLHHDEVSSYFGVRKIEIKSINRIKRICLNDTPIFMSGLLNQGYYFLGDLTPKSYQDYEFDILKMKELGFNTLRIHAKIEDERFYYYCDKYGMMVIQDFVNGGDKYDLLTVILPRLIKSRDARKLDVNGTGRAKIDSQKWFYQEVNFYLDHFNNYPSILIYTIFNEAWGEFAPSELYQYCKKKDQLHLFDTASGWLDSKDSDFYSIHTYSFPAMKRVDKHGRAFVITEAGGIGLKVKHHSYFKSFFSHQIVFSLNAMDKKVKKLYEEKLIPQIKNYGLNMIIFTQLADCEAEYNGLYTFDRQVLKVKPETIKNIHQLITTTFKNSL